MKINKKLKITLKVLERKCLIKYPVTKDYIEENLKKICEGEGLPVDEVIYFVVCVCL